MLINQKVSVFSKTPGVQIIEPAHSCRAKFRFQNALLHANSKSNH